MSASVSPNSTVQQIPPLLNVIEDAAALEAKASQAVNLFEALPEESQKQFMTGMIQLTNLGQENIRKMEKMIDTLAKKLEEWEQILKENRLNPEEIEKSREETRRKLAEATKALEEARKNVWGSKWLYQLVKGVERVKCRIFGNPKPKNANENAGQNSTGLEAPLGNNNGKNNYYTYVKAGVGTVFFFAYYWFVLSRNSYWDPRIKNDSSLSSNEHRVRGLPTTMKKAKKLTTVPTKNEKKLTQSSRSFQGSMIPKSKL